MNHQSDLSPHRAESEHDDWRLCFVRENTWAWFTNVAPRLIRGDDWNDAPHDCNASQPYPQEGQRVVVVAFDGPFEMAGTQGNGRPWPYLSADEINAGIAPWLYDPGYGETYPEPKETIESGITLRDFKARMICAGGGVYERSTP